MALRSVVKHSYIKASRDGKARAKAHVNYIKFRPGKDKEEERSRSFFTDKEEGLTSHRVHEAVEKQTGRNVLLHKVIISPGVQDANTQEYVREVMHELGQQKGLELDWYAVEHRNTANPHAHVVIMAKDRNGRLVKLSKDDYAKLRETGDKYLERNKLLEKEKLKEKEKEANKRPFGQKLKDALKAAKREFDREMKSDEEKRLTRQEAIKAQEEEALGEAPDYDKLAAKRLAKEQRQQSAKEQAWKYYSKSIEVEMAGESVKYSWNMPLARLRELEKLNNDKNLLSEAEQEKLQTWIKDAYYEDKYLSRKAEDLDKITLEASDSKPVTKDSSLARLQKAEELHKTGAVVLSPVEEKALSKWLERKLEEEPIRVNLGDGEEPVVYDKQDSRESLEFLAREYRKGEDWAKDSISKAEYKKLSAWIREKREHEKTREPEKLRDSKDE